MKQTYKTLLMLLILGIVFASCSKKSNPKPAGTDLSKIAGKWTISSWGGENVNPLNFTIDPSTAIGTITYVGPISFNYAIGDKLYFDITANSDGTYSAKGKYTYGTNNANTSTRNVILSLQNNGMQLTAYYPATSADFPAITYIYQQGSTTVEEL